MDEETRALLQDWSIPADIIEIFKKQNIKKSHLLKFTERTLELLIPTAGDRLDFVDALERYKNKQKDVEASTADIIPADTHKDISPSIISPLLSQSSPLSLPPLAPECKAVPVSSKEPVLKRSSPVDDYNLEMILKRNTKGVGALSFYTQNKIMNENHRNIIADIIINNELSKDPNSSLPDQKIQFLTTQILALFPSEIEITWSGPKGSDRAVSAGRGKLFNRFYSIRRFMSKNGFVFRSSHPHQSLPTENSESQVEETESEELLFLHENRGPWPRVEKYWESTSKERIQKLRSGRQTIHDYMESYPALKTEDGYLLLQIDFGILYPDAGMKLYTEWPVLSAFIEKKLSAKDVEEIQDMLTQDGKKIKTLLLINKLFNVVTAVKKSKAFKNTWRPSRDECREGFLLMVKSVAEIKTALARRKQKYIQYGLSLNITPIIVGDGEDYITQSYVSVNSVNYSVSSPFKAIDLAFKMAQALDATYPRECCREWLFLQQAVYGIFCTSDKDYGDSKCASLLNEYQLFKGGPRQ